MFQSNKPLNFLYWIVLGIFVFLFFYLMVKLFPLYGTVFSFLWRVFAPFLISGLLAYLLYPVMKQVHQQFHIPKGIAILLIYILFFGGIGFLIYRGYPAVLRQLHEFDDQLPDLVSMYETFIARIYEYTSFLPETVHDKMDHIINGIELHMEKLLGKMVGGVTKIVDMVVLLTVIPVLVFYFLKDYTKIKEYIKKWIPAKYHKKGSSLIKAIDKSLGGYIRGQFIVCGFVGLATFVVFKLLHLKYALLLAIVMGMTNIIPYFGPIIGSVPAVLIAAAGSVRLIVFILITVFAVQLVESNLLSPYIVGKSIHIHPVAIIFALLLGGELGNIIGMIVAVPIMTVMKVVVSELLLVK